MSTDHQVHIAFGQVLKVLRIERGISQEDFAFECNFHRTTVSLFERGRRQPTLAILIHIAAVLRIEPAELVSLVTRELERRTRGE